MTEQHRITEKTPLLLPNGHLAVRGYATQMLIDYNRKCAKKNPFNLKEWNFYQAICGDYALQMTMGHLSYVHSVSVTLIHLPTGKKKYMTQMKMLSPLALDTNPEQPSFTFYKCRQFQMSFEVTESTRILRCQSTPEHSTPVDIEIVFKNDSQNEKMVIATPFAKPHQFYLNYKENYYTCQGHVSWNGETVSFDGGTGLIDWGRGIWPYRHEWYWGNLSAMLDGTPFGFNIGWGFGDLSAATENMYFWNKRAYKVGTLKVERDEADYMKPWTLSDEEGKLHLVFTPFYDNYTQNKLLVVDTHCDQLFGTFDGYVMTDEGKKTFSGLVAFIEHAVNRW